MALFDTLNDASWVLLGKLTLSGTTPASTAAIDMQGFNALDIAVVNATVTDAGTAAGYVIKLQESDALVGTGFTDVAAADAVGGVVSTTTTSDTDDDKIAGVLGYVGGKRYVRATGTGTTLTDAVVYVMGRRSRSGLARPNTAVAASTATT